MVQCVERVTQHPLLYAYIYATHGYSGVLLQLPYSAKPWGSLLKTTLNTYYVTFTKIYQLPQIQRVALSYTPPIPPSLFASN